MNRDDGLFWISLFWFVVLCGLALWALIRLWLLWAAIAAPELCTDLVV